MPRARPTHWMAARPSARHTTTACSSCLRDDPDAEKRPSGWAATYVDAEPHRAALINRHRCAAFRRVTPIATIGVALAPRNARRYGLEDESQRALIVGAIRRDKRIGIADDDFGSRMAELVAVTGREYRDIRRHRGDECPSGRRAAAVMRH